MEKREKNLNAIRTMEFKRKSTVAHSARSFVAVSNTNVPVAYSLRVFVHTSQRHETSGQCRASDACQYKQLRDKITCVRIQSMHRVTTRFSYLFIDDIHRRVLTEKFCNIIALCVSVIVLTLLSCKHLEYSVILIHSKWVFSTLPTVREMTNCDLWFW